MAIEQAHSAITTPISNTAVSSLFGINSIISEQRRNENVAKILDFDVKIGTKGANLDESYISPLVSYRSFTETEARLEIGITTNIEVESGFTLNDYFSVIQSWIGHVTSVDEMTFSANIHEIAPKHNGTFEEAVFDLADVESADRILLKKGASFFWSVGYENRKGTRSKQSVIRFRRLPKINTQRFNSIVDRSRNLAANLNWD